ncbi:hypothetical protein L1887_40793 [Cichorium endivia]|nr:hypothetical protein L1887_40793 [Cichorium endivia]
MINVLHPLLLRSHHHSSPPSNHLESLPYASPAQLAFPLLQEKDRQISLFVSEDVVYGPQNISPVHMIPSPDCGTWHIRFASESPPQPSEPQAEQQVFTAPPMV